MAEAQAAKANIVTAKHLAAQLGEAHSLSKKQAEAVVSDLVDSIVKTLANGDKIRLAKLGTLQVRARPARKARNPATGAEIDVPASKKVAFTAAKELKEAV